jgi:hypothetical protein
MDEPVGCSVQIEGRAVTRSASGSGSKPKRPLLGNLDTPPGHLISPDAVHPTFSKHGNYIPEDLWVFFDQPA